MSQMRKSSMAMSAKKMLLSHINDTRSGFVVTDGLTKYWFNIINKAVFRGRLPRIRVYVKRLKGMCGLFIVTKYSKRRSYSRIYINSVINNRNMFLNTLAHEMVHHWQYYVCNRLRSVGHNKVFRMWKDYFITLGISI